MITLIGDIVGVKCDEKRNEKKQRNLGDLELNLTR